MTSRVEARVRVPVPAPVAFRAVVDPLSQNSWMLATELYVVDGPALSPEVGSRLAAFTALLGIGFLDSMEVTGYRPVEPGGIGRWTVRHTGRLVRGTGEFEVTGDGAGATVRWIEDVDPPFGLFGRLGWPLVAPLIRLAMQVSLRRLAAGVTRGRLPVTAADGGRHDRR
jgi:hypothetical protein